MQNDMSGDTLRSMEAGLGLVRQRRAEAEARQQMLAQMLAAGGPAPTIGGGNPVMAQPMAGGGSGTLGAAAGGIRSLAEMYRQGAFSSKPDAMPASSIPLSGMAKG